MLRLLLALAVLVPATGRARPPALPDVPAISEASVTRRGLGVTLRATLRPPPGRQSTDQPAPALQDIDLLIRLSRDERSREPLMDVVADRDLWQALTWQRINLRTGDDEGEVEAPLLRPSPVRPGTEALLVRLGDADFVRYVVPEASGSEPTSIEVELPVIDADPDNPLRPTLQVLAFEMAALSEAEFRSLPARGFVGLGALVRSTGILGADGRVAEALEHSPDLRTFLAPLAERALTTDAPDVHPYAAAAALWLLPEVAPEAFIDLTAAHLARGGVSPLNDRLQEQVEADRTAAPVVHALALDTVIPRRGAGDLVTRTLALASFMMEPPWNAALVEAIGERTAWQAGSAQNAFFDEAGIGLLVGVAKWDTERTRRVLKLLAAHRVAGALSALFGWRSEEAFQAVVERVGRDTLVERVAEMTRTEVPPSLVEALGSDLKDQRALAAEVLKRSGAPGVRAMGEAMARVGYPSPEPTTAEALAADPALLQRTLGRLQGILLASEARPYHDEAWKVHLHGGDCLPILERAREEVHPDLLLPEPLYARCRALRATLLLERGDHAEAAALVQAALRDAPQDSKVRDRFVQVMMAQARRHLDEGELFEAQAVLDEVDPTHEHPAAIPILADIEMRLGQRALALGDSMTARSHFERARRLDPTLPTPAALLADAGEGMRSFLVSLLTLLLAAGISVLTLLVVGRVRAMRDFEMDAVNERPLTLKGPAGRRLLVASHGLLTLRPLTYRLISWSEVEAAYLLTGTSDRSGLLLWKRSGDAFVVPTPTVHRFDLFVETVERHLAASGIPLTITRPMDDQIVVTNDAVVERLRNLDRWNRFLARTGLALGAVVAYLLIVLDLGANLSVLARLPLGLGIGSGLALLIVTTADVIIPVPRA